MQHETILIIREAAKLNLKISQQARDIHDFKVRIRQAEEQTDSLKKEYNILHGHYIKLQMDKLESERFTPTEEDIPSLGEQEVSSKSEPLLTSSKKNSRAEVHGDRPAVEVLRLMQNSLKLKDEEINQLKSLINEMRPKLEMNDTKNGTIEVGLSFHHVTSRLCVEILRASSLRSVNIHNDKSDPFAKLIVHRQIPGERNTHKTEYKTKVVMKTLSPVWREKFSVYDIQDSDLPHMYLEIIVYDHGRLRRPKALGKVRIGPHQTFDAHHWEEMIEQDGNRIVKTHPLQEV